MENLYLAIDADNAGRMVGRAVLANDISGLTEVSARIDHGQEVILNWVQEHGGQKISGGGDEFTASIPPTAVETIEQLRADYQFATQLTITVGVGNSLSEAGKALMAGKFRGKDQVVQYDPSVDQDLQAGQDHVAQGAGTEEEQKINEAYLSKEDGLAGAAEDPHGADCQYCQEQPEHNHTDDCQYCAESTQEPDHAHTDDCQYCAAAEEVNSHEHSDDCQYCAASEARMDHDHADSDCQYCNDAMAQQSQAGQVTGSILSEQVMTDDPTTQSERDLITGIDESAMPLGNAMEGNVSHPDNYDQDTSTSDMGLSEEEPQAAPDLNEVLRSGLDNHASSIQREKIITMVSQALDGFKANKEILERAKEQAPQLYASTIMMLKAMIEMAKEMGMGQEQGAAPQEAQPPQAAPQEGAAQAPQQ